MLSHEDRRQLEAIERNLAREDPDLARKLASWRPWRWSDVGALLLLVCAVLGAVAGVLASNLFIFLVAGVAPFLGWVWMRGRRADGRPIGL